MRAVAKLITLSLAALFLVAGTGLARAQADPNKVLRVTFPVAETGFDPQASNDLYSNHVNRAIFEALYRYDHLARPYKIVPNTAVALPEISADGLIWTIRSTCAGYFIAYRITIRPMYECPIRST